MIFPFFHRAHTGHIVLFSIGETSLLYARVQKQKAGFRVLDENIIFAKHEHDFFSEAVRSIAQILQKGKKGSQVIIGLRPGIARSELTTLHYSLPFPGKKISMQDEARILQDISKKAKDDLALVLGKHIGLHPNDLTLISLQTFAWRIDGYGVPHLRGFTGNELAYDALGVFLPAQSAHRLAELTEYSRACQITIAHSLFAPSPFKQFAGQSVLALDIGGATTQVALFENTIPKLVKEIPFGKRDIHEVLLHELGMKQDSAGEFLEQYSSGALSEETRQRMRKLLLPAVEKFGTLIKEALALGRVSQPLSVLLYGEGSALPEFRELFEREDFFGNSVSTPAFLEMKDIGIIEKETDAILSVSKAKHLRFLPLYFLLRIMELGKKFTDIIPPQSGVEKKEAPVKIAESLGLQEHEDSIPEAPRPRPMLFWGLLAAAFVGAGFGASVLLAKARVTVWPEGRDLFIQDKIKASVSQTTIDLENKVIPAARLVEEKESTRPFPATGKKTKETKAEGIIRVFNTYSTSPQTLVANTRFISESGKLFRSKSKVAVPAARYQNGNLVAGTIDIMVTAAESGESYNIGPSNFSLPGLAGTPLYTTVYGKSLQPMAGGAQTSALVVTEDDIAHSKDQLIENLIKLGKEAVGAKIPQGYTLLPGFMTSEVLSASSLAKEGTELEQFNVSAKVKVSALVFKQEDAESLMKYLLAKTITQDERIDEHSVSVSLQEERLETVQGIGVISGTAKGRSLRAVDSLALKNDLHGLSQHDALLLLAGYPGVEKYKISFSPFWLKRVPKTPNKIEIAVPASK